MIAQFIRELRDSGLTQEEIAECAGLSQGMISKFANGTIPTVESLIKIADAFKVSTDKVLGRDIRNHD